MGVLAGELDITTLKEGDIFYECEYGICKKFTVKIPPARNDKAEWKWIATDSVGMDVAYLVNEKYSHYAPKLYSYIPYED